MDGSNEESGFTRSRCLVRRYEDWFRRNPSANESDKEGIRNGNVRNGRFVAAMKVAIASGQLGRGIEQKLE